MAVLLWLKYRGYLYKENDSCEFHHSVADFNSMVEVAVKKRSG